MQEQTGQFFFGVLDIVQRFHTICNLHKSTNLGGSLDFIRNAFTIIEYNNTIERFYSISNTRDRILIIRTDLGEKEDKPAFQWAVREDNGRK